MNKDKAITKESIEAVLATQIWVYFEHKTLRNANGTRQRFRVNGAMQTWKNNPERFRLPVKRGLREYGAITEKNMHEWELV